MKLLHFLKKGNSFTTGKQVRKNITEQIRLNSKTLKRLTQYGIDANSQLSLEFFFYTNTQSKASKLATELKELNYKIDTISPAKIDSKLWVLNGWTTNLKMDLSTVNDWTTQMCMLGSKNDTMFDGWGFRSKQESTQKNAEEEKITAVRSELLAYNGKTSRVKTLQ